MTAETPGHRPPAILLAGGVIALSVARSVGGAGAPVYALGHRSDPVRHSRHCHRFVDVGSGQGLGDRLLEWLRHGPGTGVVLPCSDEAVELLATRIDEVRSWGYVPMELEPESALAMLDKQLTFDRAVAAGVEVPWTGTFESAAEARAAAHGIGFPCALKPRDSHRFAWEFGTAAKAIVVGDDRELEQALIRTGSLGLRMMITEIVPGPDASFCSYYTYLDPGGEPLFHVTKRKLRQYPPGFGSGCYHLTDWNPEVAELGLRFLQRSGVRGLANVEFKRDARDGRLKLIECNHRFTAATEQLRRCGADMALFAYDRLTGAPPPEIGAYRRGVGHWYPLNDTRSLLISRRRGELTLRDWARTLLHPQTFPLASVSDPAPSLINAGRRFARLAQRRSITSRSASSRTRSADTPLDPTS